jgi:hypothetical protein
VQKRRPRRGGGKRRGTQDNVERPRTDEEAVSAEGRDQPEIKPEVEETPAPVADAPDTTTPKKQVEDPTKLEDAGEKD